MSTRGNKGTGVPASARSPAAFEAHPDFPDRRLLHMPRPFRRRPLATVALPLLAVAALAGGAAAQDQAPAPSAPATAPSAPATAPSAPAAAPDPAAVVATIAGAPVTEADLALAEGELGQQFAQLPPEQRRAAALSAIIEIRLLAAKAVEKGLDRDADFQRRSAFLQERALHSELVDKEVADKVTDDSVRARYDKQISETPPVNEVKARHILVKTREEAVEIIKQLDGGAKFEELANQHTTDPSGKTTGGDLGYFGPGQMVPEFEAAAFALDIGAYTKEPVQSQFGFHVIKVEDKRAQQPPAFEQVRDQVRSVVFREKYFALVKEIRDAAAVEIADPELKKAIEQMDAN
jgi:peptidyl-prolyl cis-trans isomerase C